MPGYDYFHFRYLTEPGDKVHLLTTTDRVVYEFDNYDLTRGQKVNYLGYINYEHPEDMILEGYFPSKLYQERLDKTDIQPESWLQLMLEYVNVEYEQNNGYASNMRTHIFPEDIPSTDEEFEEYCKANEYLDESLEELLYERNFGDDRNCRQQADGFDYDSVDGFLISTFGEIREIKVNNNGETLFTLRDEPTRWYYMSRYYDPLHLANITKPGDKVYIISTLEKIVYGFNNQTIFNVGTSINTPNFKNKVAYIKDEDNDINSESKESYFIGWGFSVKEFWKRVNELSYEEQQKYEKLNIPKTISSY